MFVRLLVQRLVRRLHTLFNYRKIHHNHRRPNRGLWGLRSFSNEATYAAAAAAAAVVSNSNIKTAVLFL